MGDWATAGLRASVHVGWGASLMLLADYGRVLGGDRGLQLMTMLSWQLPGGHGVYGSTTRARDGSSSGALAAARSLPRGTGWGYRVQASEASEARAYDALLQGQSSFGRAELQGWQREDSEGLRARGSGGLVYIDRELYFSRPTGGGYALVKAGEVGDVRVTLENAEVGRTGSDGRLMVPGLQPYYGSRLALRDDDIPIEYDASRTVRRVATALRGGAIVDFDLKRISAISGRLTVRLHGKTEIPANGEITALVDGDFRSSPITPDGRFFLERMPLGKHVLQASWAGGTCRVPVVLLPGAPPIFEAGALKCIADVLDPESSLPDLDDPAWADVPRPVAPDAGAGGGGDL
jgi:outer membrane usher protein FimD/PapC